MARQLELVDRQATDWRLDERTREIGRQGLAEARRALQEAAKRAEA
jgi:hypothetical protein